MKKQQLILEALNLSPNAIAYHISQELGIFYPQKALLEGSDSAFDFEKYAEANFCTLKYDTSIHNQITSSWNGMENTIYHCTENASVEVTWEGYQFDILLVSFQDGFCRNRYYWMLADRQEIAERFFTTVCAWNIAEMTDGFSFAYLKELVLSSMMHWMGAMETGGMDKSMILQVAVLRKQMSSNNSEE